MASKFMPLPIHGGCDRRCHTKSWVFVTLSIHGRRKEISKAWSRHPGGENKGYFRLLGKESLTNDFFVSKECALSLEL